MAFPLRHVAELSDSWKTRYFVLHGPVMEYYESVRQTDHTRGIQLTSSAGWNASRDNTNR